MIRKWFAIASIAIAGSANAAVVSWTDWTSAGTDGSASGTITAPGGSVGVGYTGGYAFVQTGCGTNWWGPGSYNGTLNKPFDCDIVALNAGGLKTISFDTAVTDPYMALMSWNGNDVRFSAPFELISNGSGYWGSGTPIIDADDMGFVGSGEVHAIIRFSGTFTSLSFTDTSENWHGFTIGIEDRADDVPVPTPGTLALMVPALIAALAVTRRRRYG